MTDIIIGEKVFNKTKEIGTIVSFDDNYICVDFKNRVAKLLRNAFEQGFLKYENPELQNNIDKNIEQSKIEKERALENNRIAFEKVKEERKLVAAKSPSADSNISFDKVSLRLDPAPVNLTSVRKNDKELIQEIFNECDIDTKELFDSFAPKMAYPKYTSYSRSKYYVGFLSKYASTYILRIFSRNDIYKKRVRTGVTVMESDTTEILRILQINDKTYYFSKNLSYSDGFYNNSTSYNKWHISYLARDILLNEVIRKCDCAFLNDYIEETKINCLQYARLLMPALYNNKVEIVFKNKLFLPTYRINNIVGYLKEFSSKQIDFASKNNVINALPIIKHHGIFDLDILQDMEVIMKKRQYGNSIYDTLIQIFETLNFDSSDLSKKLIGFLKKIDHFNATLYYDYINELSKREGVTVSDFFDKDYLIRHDVILQEKSVQYGEEEIRKYAQVAKELSWIDREENGYFIVVPQTIAEFKREGIMQHNCVYTSEYYKFVIDHQSIVVFLREQLDTPYVTIEYDYETFDVIQAYGKYNKKIDSSLYKYIVDLGKKLNYERLSQQ